MFKLESYITPILLSYVDRYINNFKPEDFQVSLWGGDACFLNLELNLQVLEQELQLPFSFVSGSIRELLIHVPWTKLASEPIVITINTIECILNLKGKDSARNDTSGQNKEKPKKTYHGKEVEAPPGYVQLLINKIVNNIRIYCNNVILKYVEEDIVLSMNVKHLKFESANEKWEPAYIDLSPAQVILRKVITVNDLTLCLDKRNASGKIEVYQEPMLYRCSMTMHLLRNYHSATASKASTTRLDILCNNMEFSMTEQQVPMLFRLLMLLYALQQKQLKPEKDIPSDNLNVPPDMRESMENAESWTGWMWSYVSSVLPAPWEEDWNNEDLQGQSGHTLHFGFYVDNLSITFKVSELSPERGGYYGHKKMRYNPMLTLQLQGIYCETVIHGLRWLNATGGVCQALLLPVGQCSCSFQEVNEDSFVYYLTMGSASNSHKTDSLFDAEAVENKGQRRQYNTSWDHHMTANTESVLLERTAAFAFDYVYQMEIPNDMSSEILSDLGSDHEFSNLSETSCMRMCFGPLRLRLCSGFFHRIGTLQVAASYYDYSPYFVPRPDLPLQDLLPPSEEDFDALNEFIPSRSTRITFFAPTIELVLMDHPYFQPVKGQLFRKKRKMSTSTPPTVSSVDLPKLTVECQFLDISLDVPMYVNRIVHTTCQLPDPPPKMFNACFSWLNVKVVSLSSRLLLGRDKHTTILSPSTVSYSCKSILKPQYWTNPDIPHTEMTFESESVTLNGTNAKVMVVAYILDKMTKLDSEGCLRMVNSTSLLADAAEDSSLPYMEVCIEGIRFRKVVTNATISIDVSLGSVKAFIFEPVDTKLASQKDNLQNRMNLRGLDRNFASRDIQQVLFISGPEPKPIEKPNSKNNSPTENLPLFTATLQYPLMPDVQKHPPILLFNLQEIRICVDPLLCRWLLYKPKLMPSLSDVLDSSIHKTKNISDTSGSVVDTPRRISSQIESIHSSSDREPVQLPRKIELPNKEENVDMQERIYNVLKTWFDVWKGMLLYGDVSQCTIYFPLVSLSAIGSQGIQEAVEEAVNKDRPPDIMVITLPFANVRSAQRQNIAKYLNSLPISLPETIWSMDRSSFPWTMSISELSCYTIQQGNKLIFLKPVSLSATVGLSTRPAKDSVDVPAGSPSPRTDIGCLGVCVHVDMTPILISTSEVQVYLFASILYGLMEVATNLLPEKTKPVPKTPDVVPPIITKGSSTLSPTILRENTLDSASEKTPPIGSAPPESSNSDSVKLTAWIQWTITRFTIELLSNEYMKSMDDELESLQPRLKLVMDAEDIVSSLDFQSVYLKVKSKIGSMSILHFKRATPSSKWKPGPFSGIVMRLREDVIASQRHEDNGFISLTITRASCRHTHTLWGAVQNRHKDKKAESANQQLLSQSRYITEIVVNVQPIDFVISLQTLRSFYLVLVPLLRLPLKNDDTRSVPPNALTSLNNQALPLAYLDCQDIRVVMPSVELGISTTLHDVVIFQMQKISLSPTAVNPICRAPLRPDIYEQAAHSRILHIPGSEVEDRQYQLDLNGMMICTGTWKDLNSIFTPSSGGMSNLRSMSENPALEWNNLEQGQPNMAPILNFSNITEKFDISVVAAPAMVYKDTTIVCGHSVEVNFVTDIFVNLSMQQIKLISSLLNELVLLIEPFVVDEGLIKRPKLQFPYSCDTVLSKVKDDVEILINADILRDSGIDMSDMKSVLSSRAPVEKQPVFPRPPNPLPNAYATVPIEVLFTAGKISLALYETDTTKATFRHKGKKKKVKVKIDEDLGYEAEEESADDKSEKKYIPLVYICINQPNTFLSRQQIGRRLQISCFDLSLKLNGPEYMPIGHVPTEEYFSINLLETRPGIPHPNTGILPAFFTLKYTKGVGKNSSLDIDISKPTKILCSTSKWSYLLTIKDKILDTFKSNQRNLVLISKNVTKIAPPVEIPYSRTKIGDTYIKFQEIKDVLCGTNSVNVSCNQVIFLIKSDSGHELNLGMEKMESHLTLSNRPEKLLNTLKFESVTLSVINDDFKKLLLNPWTVSLDFCLLWESWQSLDSDPQIQITAESDCIVLDVSPEQIKCVEIVVRDITEFISSLPVKERAEEDLAFEVLKIKPVEKDQHYKDDLRAGAFQFIDSNSDNADELPLPYQVMFWNKTVSAMAWRYPQPRALTKVRVFPVPYKMTLGYEEDLVVLCHFEYWSECRNCYLPFTQFYLSESEVCHLTLPDNSPQPVVASTWRVVITMVANNEDVPDGSLISPRALAACMRIDSYFNKALIPNLTAAVYVTKIDVSLYSYVNKRSKSKLPDCLKNYTSDLQFPESQKFLTLTWDNLTSFLSSWEFEVMSIELNSATKCTVLDYLFLTEQPLVEPFSYKLEAVLANNLHCKFISKPVVVKFNPSIAHTLAVSCQQWQQNYRSNEIGEQDFIITTRYVICNNTNINIRFGQTGTDEDILLPPNHFNMYTWRSQKKKQLLKVALEENDWIWSKSLQVFKDGLQTIPFNSQKNVVMLVSVKSLSATQKQVTISGQLTVTNMLMEHFELKVMEAVSDNREADFKASPTYVVPGKSSTLSIFVDKKKSYILRLRFYGLESSWTGDIPLREHSTGSQPWLVKVPLQERGQFLSIWCRIMRQDLKDVKRTLAVLWPLFTVKSNLPINTQVHIETPTLNVRLDALVKGRGELQQLYCPGTIDHSHQLTFKLDKSNSPANPYVPLNYSLVDHQKFFKKMENLDIDEILKVLSTCNESKWPYFGDDLDNIDWIVEDQPLTHVQVRYQNACMYSCSLLVELIPWCLLVNTLGTPIAVMLNGTELCRLQHHGIVAPPKLEENFTLAVYTGGSRYFSNTLQLVKSDWSQTFYMPKFTGTVPLDGSIKTAVKSDTHVCMVAISSSVANEMRLLRVSSTHVISSHMTMQMQVVCLAVPEGDKVFQIPKNIEQYSFTVAPHLHKSNSGVPIIQWRLMQNTCDCSGDYALYIAFCVKPDLGWSCPIRVDKPLMRKSFCVAGEEHPVPIVLTSQEHKGQVFLALHNDDRPQIFVENKTSATIFCGQAVGEGEVAKEAQHFKWHCHVKGFRSIYYTMPCLSEKFPELPQDNFSEKIALACDPESDQNEYQWSSSISIINDNEQFVRIPYYGDIRLTILNSACTTFLIIDSVSQVEISARDIRVRLTMHESEGSSKVKTEVGVLSDLYTSGDLSRSLSDTSVAGSSKYATSFQKLPTVTEQLYVNALAVPSRAARRWSDTNMTSTTSSFPQTLLVNTLPMQNKWSSIRIDVYVRSFSIILMSDVEKEGTEMWELANLVCDDVAVSATQSENMKLKISMSDVQLDNQLYSKESFDFPVVLVGQEDRDSKKPKKKLSSLNIPIENLLEHADKNALFIATVVLETWRDRSRDKDATGIKNIKMTINPLSCYVEDIYITRLMDYLAVFVPTTLVMWPEGKNRRFNITSGLVSVPEIILWHSAILARPLTMRNFSIAPVSILLSVHSSIKLYIALDQSPLQFSKFERRRLFTTPYRLGHALTMHYLSGAIFGAGWVVSSLELLGSPGGLARAMGTGLRDFVSLPYRGLVIGPMAFLRGITQGSASLMKHVTAGTLQSVTKLASSVARNLDRLTLDEEHLKRTEEQRRQRPQGLAEGFLQGLTGLGISMLGAVGGIAHHPLQSMMTDGASPRSLAAGVGLGLVGVFTKPLSGAAELVALTGQGLLQGAGWNSMPSQRSSACVYKIEHSTNSALKYTWKLINSLSHFQMLYITEATSITNSDYAALTLILTLDALIVINTEEDSTERIISLSELSVIENKDPTMLEFKLSPPLVYVKSEDETVIEMDPASRARVADYVRSTVGILNLPVLQSDHSDISISPLSSPGIPDVSPESTVLNFYVNPQSKNYFLRLLTLAKQHRHNYNFPVL